MLGRLRKQATQHSLITDHPKGDIQTIDKVVY